MQIWGYEHKKSRRRIWLPLLIGVLWVLGFISFVPCWYLASWVNATWDPDRADAGPLRQVAAVVETEPVPSDEDAADDPAIWVHPSDPAQSTIIGTDKLSAGPPLALPSSQPSSPPTPTLGPTPALPLPTGLIPAAAPSLAGQVAAVVETEPVPSSEDVADDPAIWVHPSDPAQSIIIGTNKDGGLAVYDLAGKQLQYLPDGEMNNVDLRYNFPLGGQPVALVTAGNRSNDSIALYQINSTTRHLENVAARIIQVGINEVYGSCMYHSPRTLGLPDVL